MFASYSINKYVAFHGANLACHLNNTLCPVGGEGLCGELFDGFQVIRDAFLGLGICMIFGEYFRSVIMTDVEDSPRRVHDVGKEEAGEENWSMREGELVQASL